MTKTVAVQPPHAAEVAVPARHVAEQLGLVFLGLLFVLPFLLPIHRLPQPAFDAEWLAAMLLVGAAIGLGSSGTRRVPVNLPLPGWFVVMVALVAIQSATGRLHYSGQLVLACVYALAITGAYLTGRAVLALDLRERAAVALSWGLVVGSVASVLVQWLQLLDVRGLPNWLVLEILDPWYRTRPVGNIAQVNLLATYFVWSMFAVLFLLTRSLRPGLAFVLLFVVSLGLAFTRSRMGLVFSIGVVAAIWLPWALRPSSLRARAAMTVAIAAGYAAGAGVIGVFVVYQGAAVDNAVQRFGEVGGFAVRALMWSDALKVAASAPFLGVGFADYAAHQYWITEAGPDVVATTYVHNLVLQTAAELGWPMAVALCGIGAWWVLAQWRERLGQRDTALVWALLVTVGLHSMLEWPLAALHFALPAALLFALAEPRLASPRAQARIDSRLMILLGVMGVLLALPMKLEFDEISDVMARAETQRRSSGGIEDTTLLRMMALVETARLPVYAESMVVRLRAPANVEASQGEIERHERLFIGRADPQLIGRLVILYAKAGRMDDSVRNAARLKVFHRGQYAEITKVILQAVEPLGSAADPLRKELSTGAPADAGAPSR